MVTDAEKRDSVRSLRGSMIRAIYRAEKSEVSATELFLLRVCRTGPSMTVETISDAMVYLVTSKLVERHESKIDAGDTNPLITFSLTASGISLAERTATDANVNMD